MMCIYNLCYTLPIHYFSLSLPFSIRLLSCRTNMKIFDWVHRKFHPKPHEYMVSPKKDQFAYNDIGKYETVSVTSDIDTNALLNQVTLMDMWKDGILTIGTLGFEYIEEEYTLPDEQEEQEKKVYSVSPSVTREKQSVKPCVENVPCLNMDTAVAIKVEETPEITPLLEIVEMKKRVTLADLLSADKAVASHQVCNRKLSADTNNNKTPSTENNKKGTKKMLFSNKQKGEDSRPKGKLRRMMHKMLKKKIYPDLEGKDGQKNTAEETHIDGKPDELLSLIPGESSSACIFIAGVV